MTIEERLIQAGIDWKSSLSRFGGNQDLYVRFLKKFTEDKTFQELQAAWSQEDTKETEVKAHTLKGVCANLGMTVLAEQLDRIVQVMRNEENGFANPQMLSDCEREYEKIWKVLEELD